MTQGNKQKFCKFLQRAIQGGNRKSRQKRIPKAEQLTKDSKGENQPPKFSYYRIRSSTGNLKSEIREGPGPRRPTRKLL